MLRMHLTTLLLAVSVGLFSVAATKARGDETAPPAVGKKAPDFELETLDGKKHKLSRLVKEGPVVLLMLRGYPTYQCPLCTRQMADFLNSAEAFADQGATVVFVYPDTKDGVAEHAQEFIKGKKFPKNFLFLLDPDFKFTNSYGLRWDAPKETSYPSTFIVDGDQKVTFAKISKTHGGRTKAKDILGELKK